MADMVNMSLDEIIKQNRVSRSRGRGNGTPRGRGGGRGGRARGRGRGNGRGGGNRGRSQSRSGTPLGRQGRSRSRSRGPRGRSQSRNGGFRGRSQSRARSQSQSRSRSRQQRRSVSRGRSMSRSRSQLRGLTPRGRAGLEENQEMPPLIRFTRGGAQNRLFRSNSNPNLQGSVHSRLGVTTRRGFANLRKPLAVAKRGISKRGQIFSTGNRYSNVGLRSDQILKEQRQNLLMQSNMIRSQTFRRSRNNSLSSNSQLTVSVLNDFSHKRRNSVGNSGYLNKQTLAQLTNQFGGYNLRKGPGSVRSMGSNRSNRSAYSNQSRGSKRNNRGRGRGGNLGVGRKFVKQILNPKLQKEIAAIQGKSSVGASSEVPGGINFTPTPVATGQSLHKRFGIN